MLLGGGGARGFSPYFQDVGVQGVWGHFPCLLSPLHRMGPLCLGLCCGESNTMVSDLRFHSWIYKKVHHVITINNHHRQQQPYTEEPPHKERNNRGPHGMPLSQNTAQAPVMAHCTRPGRTCPSVVASFCFSFFQGGFSVVFFQGRYCFLFESQRAIKETHLEIPESPPSPDSIARYYSLEEQLPDQAR